MGETGRGDRRRRRDRRGARAAALRRLRAESQRRPDPQRRADAARGRRVGRPGDGHRQADDRGRPRGAARRTRSGPRKARREAAEAAAGPTDSGESAGEAPAAANPDADRRPLVWSNQMAAGAIGKAYDATWGRLFARFYDRALKATEENGLGEMRSALLAEARGRVVEIGAGTGVNLDLYGPGVEDLTLVEPDPHMGARLRERLGRDPRRDAARPRPPGRRARRSDSLRRRHLRHRGRDAGPLHDPRSGRGDRRARPRPQTGRPAALHRARPLRRTRRAPAGRTASRSPGASSPTAATATATPRPPCAPRPSRSRSSSTARCRKRRRSSGR